MGEQSPVGDRATVFDDGGEDLATSFDDELEQSTIALKRQIDVGKTQCTTDRRGGTAPRNRYLRLFDHQVVHQLFGRIRDLGNREVEDFSVVSCRVREAAHLAHVLTGGFLHRLTIVDDPSVSESVNGSTHDETVAERVKTHERLCPPDGIARARR